MSGDSAEWKVINEWLVIKENSTDMHSKMKTVAIEGRKKAKWLHKATNNSLIFALADRRKHKTPMTRKHNRTELPVMAATSFCKCRCKQYTLQREKKKPVHFRRKGIKPYFSPEEKANHGLMLERRKYLIAEDALARTGIMG